MHELVPSVSIQALVMRRDALVERVTKAHELLVEADGLAAGMFGAEYSTRSGLALRLERQRGIDFLDARGLEAQIKEIDGRAWSYLLRESGLRSFMDAQARAEWEKAIDANAVIPLTEANIAATFRGLYEERGAMFERGVVAVFKKLSWVYKTNSPVKFGKRLVLRGVVCQWSGGTRPDSDGCDKIDDLIRVMSVLDGHPEPDHRQSAYRRLDAAKWPTEAAVFDFGYFTVRGFKNGNAHLTFGRLDLVDRMNQIIARHYPNALAPTREAA